MIKFLFFDYQEIERVRGFTRRLNQPTKHAANPLLVSDGAGEGDAPWEHANMQLYGSVVRRPDGLFQLWYQTHRQDTGSALGYAESDDGLTWRRPAQDVLERDGMKTNFVFEQPHGASVIYDAADPREDWRYKLLSGARPSNCISAFHSADGIHWIPVKRGPVIGTNPDCPMGFLRAVDGRYVVYHRVWGHGRRIFRSESWDFVHWTGEPRLVLEPDAGDPTNTQFYGLGATRYGPYELGTLWLYHTTQDDPDIAKMGGIQEPELAYTRSGYAWHRAAQRTPFIPNGLSAPGSPPGAWDRGNLQCASSPLYLDDEIRYYYAGTQVIHVRGWHFLPQRAGLGLATLKPDRFIALDAGDEPAELLTAAFPLVSGEVRINADIAAGGWVRVGIVTADCEPLAGLGVDQCLPLDGDDIARRAVWPDAAMDAYPIGKWVRIVVHARLASLYSIAIHTPGETPVYHRFQEGNPQRNQVGRVEVAHPTELSRFAPSSSAGTPAVARATA